MIDPPRRPENEIFDPDERVQVRLGSKKATPTYINGTVLGHAWWEKRGVKVELDDERVLWFEPREVRRLTLLELIAEAAK